MNNIGKIIKDPYCNGFFGRVYDLDNSIIIGEGDAYVVIKKDTGEISFCAFQEYEYDDNNNIKLAVDSNDAKQNYINSWCLTDH